MEMIIICVSLVLIGAVGVAMVMNLAKPARKSKGIDGGPKP